MRFLLDENLSRLVAAGLKGAGHEAIHVRDVGMSSATDAAVLEFARENGHVVVSADTDFGTFLAESRAQSPSVVLIRRTADRRANRLLALLLANMPQIEEALGEGAVVVLEDARVRIRRLPLL